MVDMLSPEGHYLDMQCDFIGKCFQKSVKDGYDSKIFIENVISSRWGQEVIDLDNLKQYAYWTYMYEGFERNIKLVKSSNQLDDYLMWMYGYLMKYWVSTRETTALKVYEVLPVELFASRFTFYHTQGWEYIIEDSIEYYNKTGKYKED